MHASNGLGLRILGGVLALSCAWAVLAQPPQRSLYFNGDGSVTFPHDARHDASVAVTVEAWVHRDLPFGGSTNRFDTLVSRDWRSSLWFGIANTGRLRFYRSGGVGYFRDSTATVPWNRWTHVAASYDGSRVRFYLDGQPAGDEALSHAGVNRTQTLYLGNNLASGLALRGYLDEVRPWAGARTQQEIAANRFDEINNAPALLFRVAGDGSFRDTVADRAGTATRAVSHVWGVLPRDWGEPTSHLSINFDSDHGEFVAAGAEQLIWRYLTATGAARDVEGFAVRKGDHLYLAIPDMSLRAGNLNVFQPLWVSFMFAPAPFKNPEPSVPQPTHVRIDSTAENLDPGATNILSRSTGSGGWITSTTPAPGASSWEVVTAGGCEFDCPRIFRIHSSLLGGFDFPKPALLGEFAYAVPFLFLPAYSLPTPFNGDPNNPATRPLMYFSGPADVPRSRVIVEGSVRDITAGADRPLQGRRVSLFNPHPGTVFGASITSAEGQFRIETDIFPTNAPLRLMCDTPEGVWRHLDPAVTNTAGMLLVLSADRFNGVTYTNRGFTGTKTLGAVRFNLISHRSPSVSAIDPLSGTPRWLLRETPPKFTSPTRFELSGANFHPFCVFYLSHVNGDRPSSPGDPLPSGATVTNFALRVAERAPDWSRVTLELDFTVGLPFHDPRH